MDMLGTLFETVEDRTIAHVHAVLRGEDVARGLKPTARQIDLLRVVVDRRGAARAISAADLANRLRCSDRDVRSDVNDLRMIFAVKIGSARGEQPGYYLITTTEELFDTVRPFLNQATKELRVVRALCSKHELAELAGQLNLNIHDLQIHDLQPRENNHAA